MDEKDIPKIPTIVVDHSSVVSLTLFNPNKWEGQSRGVVQSCSAEHSVTNFGILRLTNLCKKANKYCSYHIDTLKHSWKNSPWDLSKGIYYAQVPEIHLLIEAFFAGIKSLLDLLVQLLSTEGIVGIELDGFHRAGDVYGGRVLNALERNVKAEKREVAKVCTALINEHKANWIDAVIQTRDFLVHPTRGAYQLMFRMNLNCKDGYLVCSSIVPPSIGQIPIYEYAEKQLLNADRFAEAFQSALIANRSSA